MIETPPGNYAGLDSDEREELQTRKLRELVSFLEESSSYWREAFAEFGFSSKEIESADDLLRAPWLDKGRYLAEMERDPPYGGLLTAPLESVEIECNHLPHDRSKAA